MYHDDSTSQRFSKRRQTEQQIATPISSISHTKNTNPANIHRTDTTSNRIKPPIIPNEGEEIE
jgi:hypothetical protein